MTRYEKPAVAFLTVASSAIQSQMLHNKNINTVPDAGGTQLAFTSGSAYDLDE